MTGNTGKHAAVNGLEMYYEIHGEGEPLILLHGASARSGCSERCCRRHAVPRHARAIKIAGRESQER